MKKLCKSWLVLVLSIILAVGLLAAGCGSKETKKTSDLKFPTKPITIINPFSAGGSADTTVRVLTKYAKDNVGQPLIVENRAGGGGTIGQAAGAKAAPDGYTLTLITPSAVFNPIFNDKLSYTWESFEPVILLVNDPDYLVVRNVAPYNNFDTFMEYARKNPEKVRIGNSGPNTSDGIAALELEKLSGAKFTHIPFDGNSMSMPALMGGHIEAVIVNYSDCETKVKAGELKMIAMFAKERSKATPDVPTTVEKGINLVSGSFRGLAAPAKTDPKIVKYLHDAFKKTMDSPEYQEQMKKVGLPASYMSSADFKALMKLNYERYKNYKK